MKKRVLILSASVGSGHVKAAEALEKEFHARPEVEEIFCDDSLDHTNILHKQFYSALYAQLSKVMPEFLGWWYESSDDPWVSDKARLAIDIPNALPLINLIRDFKPDSIVCTHFMPAGIISLLIGAKRLEAELSIVVTDFHFHAMWITRAFHYYFVAQEEDRIHMKGLGFPSDRVIVSGIPIDPAFAQPIDAVATRERLGLHPTKPILLVAGGALGLSPAESVVRRMMRVHADFQAVVICGKNEELKKSIQEITRHQKDRFHVLGYTKEMRNLMGIASLLLSKPGGLTTAEALACHLPMIVLDPIGGQEERNSDVLLENGAAIKCAEVTLLDYKLQRLLENPARLQGMAENAGKLGHPHASATVADHILHGSRRPAEIITRSRERALRKNLAQG